MTVDQNRGASIVITGADMARALPARSGLTPSREKLSTVQCAAMDHAVPAELRQKVLARIDDDEVVRLACELIRIPSFTTEETPCAEWLASYLGEQGLLERGLGRLAKAAVDVPKTSLVVRMVRRNLHLMTGAEPEHFGVRLPQSYAGNDTTHLWAAVHVELADLFLCTRVLALTALEAAL
jgi:hypothetical protein